MVRLALFSILGSEILDGAFCDLYAGTGSVAIEALSRGAPRASAVENNAKALQCLRRTSEDLSLSDELEIVKLDAARFRRPGAFHVAFADPPFSAIPDDLLERCLDLVHPGGWAVVQWPSDRPRQWPQDVDVRRYGASTLALARKDA
jgi:16S rRNA (guanine(966)-N(2))-methyltransferase RsmD